MENDPRNRRPNSPKGAPIGWTIKKSEARAVLAEGVWTQDPEFSDGCGPAYVSDKDELLLFNNTGKSVLYASRQALIKRREEFSSLPAPTHVLEGLLPQGPHFIEAVPALIDELAQKLGLPREALDESLDVVEKAIKAKIRPRKRILEIPNLFAAIVAYTGEVGRALTGGRWQLNEVHGGIWEPYVLFDNDHDYLNPFFETYRNIVERKYGGLMLVPLVVAHTSNRLQHV
jgi:hypothetical protein